LAKVVDAQLLFSGVTLLGCLLTEAKGIITFYNISKALFGYILISTPPHLHTFLVNHTNCLLRINQLLLL